MSVVASTAALAKASFGRAWTAFSGAAKSAGTAAKEAAIATGQSVKAADAYVGAQVQQHGFGKAITGISKAHPVYATLAATGLAAGTVYAGGKVIGKFTGREEARRAQAAERDR